MNDWNPNKYLQFKSERTQPSIDLISKIQKSDPKSIIDIGCGPGNSTQILVNRWPKAEITGLDNSEEMIKTARQDYPNQEWIVNDFSTHEFNRKFDVVFSNAAIQWMPNHSELLKKFRSLLTKRGVVAVQIPQFWDMPLGKIIDNTAKDDRWRIKTESIANIFTIHNYSFYYDVLSQIFSSVEMWETDYLHVLNSHSSIVEMMRSTGLKPYYESLNNDSDISEFEGVVLKEIIIAYPEQSNGKVILPFKRLFFTAHV